MGSFTLGQDRSLMVQRSVESTIQMKGSSNVVNRKTAATTSPNTNDTSSKKESPHQRPARSSTSFKGGFFAGILVSAGLGLIVLFALRSQGRLDSLLGNLELKNKPMMADLKATTPESTNTKVASSRKKLQLLPQFKDQPDPGYQKTGSPNMDACSLLSKCFDSPDSMYKTMESCWQNIGLTLQYLDSAFMVERDEATGQDELIAFISIDHQKRRRPSDQIDKALAAADSDLGMMHAMFIYNVCVRPDRRGTGVGKKMVNEFVDQLIQHYGLEKWAKSTNFAGIRAGSTEPVPLLLGLDVEWPTPMSAEAFAMYAKMGYMRWWQPCGSVGYIDWTGLTRTGHSKYLHSSLTSVEEMRKEIQDAKDAPSRYSKSHFCMFRYYSDSWVSIGQYLRDSLEQYPRPSEPEPSKA